LFFNLTDSLCQRYTSLNPFIIRREKSGEVFKLINRIINSVKVVPAKSTAKGNEVRRVRVNEKTATGGWY